MEFMRRAKAALFRGLDWHRTQLVQRPYITNAITSGTLMIIGDRIAQNVEQRKGKAHGSARESYTRTGVLAAWTSCVSAPFWTWWYMYLDKVLPGRMLLWVGVTALVPAPAWNFLFFTCGTALEHLALAMTDPIDPRPFSAHSLAALEAKVREKVSNHFVPTVMRSASVWIPVNMMNFYWVSRDYRTTVGASVGLVWNVYMSLVQHTDEDGQEGNGSTSPPGEAPGETGPIGAAVMDVLRVDLSHPAAPKHQQSAIAPAPQLDMTSRPSAGALR